MTKYIESIIDSFIAEQKTKTLNTDKRMMPANSHLSKTGMSRTKVWKDSETLWTDAIKHFPGAPVPRTNRANYLISKSSGIKDKAKQNEMLQTALDDCNEALKTNANHAKGYENRQNIYLRLNKVNRSIMTFTG